MAQVGRALLVWNEERSCFLTPSPKRTAGLREKTGAEAKGGPFSFALGGVLTAHWLATFHLNAFHLGPRSGSWKYLVPGAAYQESGRGLRAQICYPRAVINGTAFQGQTRSFGKKGDVRPSAANLSLAESRSRQEASIKGRPICRWRRRC